MATRTSFQKRQKELLRLEKQRDKAAKRLARKAASKSKETDPLQPFMEQIEQPDEEERRGEDPAP